MKRIVKIIPPHKIEILISTDDIITNINQCLREKWKVEITKDKLRVKFHNKFTTRIISTVNLRTILKELIILDNVIHKDLYELIRYKEEEDRNVYGF